MDQHPPKIFLVKNWIRIQSQEKQQSEQQITDDFDEALSLCDLATNEHDDPEEHHPQQRFSDQQDFNFRNSPENKMCTAEELFFRGQILPLRHSVTLPTRTREFMTRSMSVSRSEPVSVASSRSSSLNSSTSGSDLRNRNQFYSHPSPTPHIRTRSLRRPDPKLFSKWSYLQLGPLKVEEIGLADLRNRSQRSHGKGSNMQNESENAKKKMVFLSFAGCKCSADVVESAVSSRISVVKPTGLSEKESDLCFSKESNVGRRKHAVSSHRTSNQLFIQKNVP